MKNLLLPEYGESVQRTNLTRKITIDGSTKAYPVYKVKLDMLYYNDQNDRIATWISQYKGEHGNDAFANIDVETYNSIIETFIVQSNPAAIEKTKNNIELVSQREPGVILMDGRVIDGNRRFTCLRKLSHKDEKFNWFETVILDKDIENSKKQIKMLELEIQHGEEQKVDYNPMDRLVGVYQDIVETGLLTVEEYAAATNETVGEVNRRIEQANLMVEFLDYIGMPKQYYVARDYQLGSIMPEIPKVLRRCVTKEERDQAKKLIFTNLMMKSADDNARYIRELPKMMENGFFGSYLKEQNSIGEDVQKRLEERKPETLEELKTFVKDNEDLTDELKESREKTLLQSKKKETRNRPAQIIQKSISILKDVDTNIIDKMSESEKDKFKSQVDKLVTVADRFGVIVSDNASDEENDKKVDEFIPSNDLDIAYTRIDYPEIVCLDCGKQITNLLFSLNFSAAKLLPFQKDEAEYELFFLDDSRDIISDVVECDFVVGENKMVRFTLQSKASMSNNIKLAIRYSGESRLVKLIPFDVNISFSGDFDI